MLRRLLRRSFVRDTNGINNNHTLLVNSKRIESTSRRHHDNTIDFCVTYKHQRSFVSSSFLVSSLSNHFLPRKSVAAVSNRNHLFFVQRRQKQSSSILSSSSIIQIDPIVLDAIENGDPVVALESTIIAHGMPYPQNVHLSNTLNEILRKKGVQPATIAIKDGLCRIGLTDDEINDLALAGGRATKCSTREISMMISKHNNMHRRTKHLVPNNDNTIESQWGATTVASTMFLANLAGISTFVTGGVGGVHRFGETSMDISADLTELSRTPVIVVSAGIKSILDIQRTLEVLETYGVPTIGYQTDDFPAFFSPKSGFKVPIRMDDPIEIATSYLAANELGLKHGFLVAVPNQDPAGENVEESIQSALHEATERGIHGKDVTPYILRRVAEQTSGDSLRSNIALVIQNASVGADIAIAISNQRSMMREKIVYSIGQQQDKKVMPQHPATRSEECYPRVVVLGGVVLDMIAKPLPNEKLLLHTSNPSVCYESDGGVGRNISEVLGRLGSAPTLYSVVGNDYRGTGLCERLNRCGIVATDESIRVMENERTATYLAILNEDGDLHTACADMSVFDRISMPPSDVLAKAEILVIDANPHVITLRQTAFLAKSMGVKVFFEPTSVSKARKVGYDDTIMSSLTYASPNLEELAALDVGGDGSSLHFDENDLSQAKEIAKRVLLRMNSAEAYLIVTCGEQGVLLASKENPDGNISIQAFPAERGIDVKNATGAGDTLAGAFIHAILNGKTPSEAVQFGMEAASLSLQYSEAAISPILSTFQCNNRS